MKISSYSKNYFIFQFQDDEKNNYYASKFIEKFKNEIPHGARYWFPKVKAWRIHNDYFNKFMELLMEYYRDLVFKQRELFK